MSDFTASNGIQVRHETHWAGSHRIVMEDTGEKFTFTAQQCHALLELMEHDHDVQLGRWRYPKGRDNVVIEADRDSFGGRTVYVFNERTFDRFHFNERVRDATEGATEAHLAARAYFEAHPESKPWHDAKPGEVWILTFSDAGGGGTDPWTVDRDLRFTHPNYINTIALTDSTITAGECIWTKPEATS